MKSVVNLISREKNFQATDVGRDVVKSIEISKVSVKDKLVIDVNVWMKDPQDFDFAPRATLSDKSVVIQNNGEDDHLTSIDLDDEQFQVAERDRMLELRVKFSVDGMHGVLTHRTKNIRDGPNSKKLAEPRWKTILPLTVS